jgi:hypothetical protein
MTGESLRGKADFMILCGLVAIVMFACAEKTAQTPGGEPESDSSLIREVPIGATASAIVELEDMYRSPETYDAKITVLEVLRGEKSADLIKKASVSNAPAQSGFDYVMARIRFEYSARGAPGDKAWNLSGKQFHAFSGEGKPYGIPSIVLPDPELAGELHAGDSRQGWIAFEVAKQDRQPLMIFDPGNVWFQLY